MRQQHREQEETTGVTYTGGQARITPQELAQAVSALEARKEAEARLQTDTVPIHEVIQHLGLDITQDELLAEVQAQRAKVSPKTRTTEQRLHDLHANYRTAIILVTVLSSVSVGILFAYVSSLNSQLKLAQETITRYQIPSLPTATTTPVSTPAATQPLATISEGQPVYATFSDVIRLAEGASSQKIMVANTIVSQAPGMRQWELLKFRDHIFVRAWRYRPEAVSKYSKNSDSWVSAQPTVAEDEFADQIPIERFKTIKEPPSIVDPTSQTNEQVYLPQK